MVLGEKVDDIYSVAIAVGKASRNALVPPETESVK